MAVALEMLGGNSIHYFFISLKNRNKKNIFRRGEFLGRLEVLSPKIVRNLPRNNEKLHCKGVHIGSAVSEIH